MYFLWSVWSPFCEQCCSHLHLTLFLHLSFHIPEEVPFSSVPHKWYQDCPGLQKEFLCISFLQRFFALSVAFYTWKTRAQWGLSPVGWEQLRRYCKILLSREEARFDINMEYKKYRLRNILCFNRVGGKTLLWKELRGLQGVWNPISHWMLGFNHLVGVSLSVLFQIWILAWWYSWISWML